MPKTIIRKKRTFVNGKSSSGLKKQGDGRGGTQGDKFSLRSESGLGIGDSDFLADFIMFLLKSTPSPFQDKINDDYYDVPVDTDDLKPLGKINTLDDLIRYVTRQPSFLQFTIRHLLYNDASSLKFIPNSNMFPSQEKFLQNVKEFLSENVSQKIGFIAGRVSLMDFLGDYDNLSGYSKTLNPILFSLEVVARRILNIKASDPVTPEVRQQIDKTIQDVLMYLREIKLVKKYKDNLSDYIKRPLHSIIRPTDNNYGLYRLIRDFIASDTFKDELRDMIKERIKFNFKHLIERKIQELSKKTQLSEENKNHYYNIIREFNKLVDNICKEEQFTEEHVEALVQIMKSAGISYGHTKYIPRLHFYFYLKNYNLKISRMTSLMEELTSGYIRGLALGNGATVEITEKIVKQDKNKYKVFYLRKYVPPDIVRTYLPQPEHKFKQQPLPEIKPKDYEYYASRRYMEKLKQIDMAMQTFKFDKGGMFMDTKDVLAKELQELQKVYDEYKRRYSRLRDQLDDLQLKEDIGALTEREKIQKEEMEKQLAEIQTTMSQVKSEIVTKANALKKIKEEQSEINAVKQQVRSQEEKINNIAQSIADMQTQFINVLTKSIEQLTAGMSQVLQNAIREQTASIKTAIGSDIQQLGDRVNDVALSVKSLADKIEKADTERSLENTQLIEQIKTLMQKIEERDNVIIELNKRLEQRDEMIESLKTMVDALNERLKERDVLIEAIKEGELIPAKEVAKIIKAQREHLLRLMRERGIEMPEKEEGRRRRPGESHPR